MNFTHLPDVLLYALAGIFLLLALASILSVLLQKRRRKDYTELRLRVRTWWLIVGVFCLVVVSVRRRRPWCWGW